MYSGDMRSDASIVSRSGPLVEVIVYGTVAAALGSASEARDVGNLGRQATPGSKACLTCSCSSGVKRSDLAMRGTMLHRSESRRIRSKSSLRCSVHQSVPFTSSVGPTYL